MPRRIELKWFRLWAPEEIGMADPDGFNSYEQLGPQEHWCWVALRALCASTDFQPAVCVTPFLGYTDQQFAQFFKVNINVWMSTKSTLAGAHKIEVDPANIIRIVDWERYCGRFFQGRQNRDGEMKLWTAEDGDRERQQQREAIDMFTRTLTYLNEKSGKKFRVGCSASFKHFAARLKEGATEAQFRHVVEIKCAQWCGRRDMEIYLRPQTLFNSAKFWDYVAEPPVRPDRPIGGTGSMTVFPEEIRKYEEEAKVEYDKRVQAAMAKYGWKTTEEIDYFRVPTFNEFLRSFIKTKRSGKDWRLE